MNEIVLSDADIQSIINGRDVIKKVGDQKIKIRQSYLKDMAAPVINDRFQIKDTVIENQVKAFRSSMKNSYELGG
ncbi:hypothetical protein ACFFH2_15670 [Enterococcus devriesei]|uniref:Uncharacterized protein n=1 Tax=Enterococcus devriesei TaxID=319970 RepID=A0A1L8SW21_9ENTE|nr:hypothetical protein [Enterococcus devriesei]OJG36215.1 hypothetical protein RV00_GL001574 [Enterococcus devriesei]